MDHDAAVAAFSEALLQLTEARQLLSGLGSASRGAELGKRVDGAMETFCAALGWLITRPDPGALVGFVLLPDTLTRTLDVFATFSEARTAALASPDRPLNVVEMRVPR